MKNRSLRMFGRRFWLYASDDSGLAFVTIMAIVGVTSVVLGAWGTGEAVNNKMTTDQAAVGLEQQAQIIVQRTEGNDSDSAKALQQNAAIMQQAAGAMRDEANWDVTKNAVTLVVDAATLPLNATSKLGQAAKFGWDFYSGTQIGQNAMNAVQSPSPDTSESMKLLMTKKTASGSPAVTDGSEPDYSKNDPVDGFIFQAKANVMSGEVQAMYPDSDPVLIADLATSMVIDLEIDKMSNPDSEVTLSDGNPFLGSDVVDMTSKIDPSNSSDIAMGEVDLSPEDKQALENGDKDFVIGQYVGSDGLYPVKVTGDLTTGLETEFTILEDQPTVNTDTEYKPVIDEMPEWWDGTVDSCPYLYVWDGDGYVAVNDIISVSRDKNREYDDFMLFDARASKDGSYEVRIVEIRDEESWLDHVTLHAVDVPDGMGAAVTPSGDVLSTGDVRTANSVWGASPVLLSQTDGAGARIYDGAGPEAQFYGVDDDAVLLISMDGFEDDGDAGALLFQRPTVFVEAWNGSDWVNAGGIRPRAEIDTVAIDVSAFVVNGTVRVRLSSDSCHTDKFQILDRLVLSTASSDLAAVRPIAISRATMAENDVSDALAKTDDIRVHTVPGDIIRIGFVSDADHFVLESRGWYKPLE